MDYWGKVRYVVIIDFDFVYQAAFQDGPRE